MTYAIFRNKMLERQLMGYIIITKYLNSSLDPLFLVHSNSLTDSSHKKQVVGGRGGGRGGR